jgi:multicomponent Na+:H+ antiporter subunit D
MENAFFLIALLLSSFIPAMLLFFLAEKQVFWRNTLNLIGVASKLALVIFLFFSFLQGQHFRLSFEIIQGVEFLLKIDELSLLFAGLSSILWFFTTLYAIGYLKGEQNQGRFFAFFSLCVTATVGIAIAGNLFTFFLFYEFLTLVTFPLLLHNKNEASKMAAISYLKYTIFGGGVFLFGLVLLHILAGSNEFVSGGYLQTLYGGDTLYLQILFVILLVGVGVKAAIFPLHGWLPKVMAAPAPVSALLHAVAVVKAGAFGVVRIVYEIYGIEFASSLGLLSLLMAVAIVTILYGSFQALFQKDLKKRLAYSTVSQVSYILLGISLFGPLGTIGGLVHLVHQGVMKITLFFCAGAFSTSYKITQISQMDGLGKTMPLASLSFTIAALGMIGIPPTAGFITKWYLGLGALENDLWFVLGVIGLSALLNSAYFLPILYRIWFKEPLYEKQKRSKYSFLEGEPLLILPLVSTALLSLFFGIFSLSDVSALGWVKLLVYLEYPQ